MAESTAGAVIAAHMKAAGVTQARAAELAGLNQSAVSRILAGTRDPSLSTVLRLLGGLGLSLRWLHERGVRPPG